VSKVQLIYNNWQASFIYEGIYKGLAGDVLECFIGPADIPQVEVGINE